MWDRVAGKAMCGIAGYIGVRKVDGRSIRACLSLMGRRGPDYANFYEHSHASDCHVCLLHSRLSILDLDPRSNQPFREGSKMMVFNGEIYNYLELKSELSPPRGEWRTRGDTEVLATVLAQSGQDGLDACEGMWALACYDETDGSLLLSRDRFGEKPLYVWRIDKGLFFGSEVKFIAALAGRWPAVNVEQLYRFMVYGFRSLYKGRDTFFKEVELLPRSSMLTVSREGEKMRRYWVPLYQPESDMTYEEAVEGARGKLIRSMELRLRADVPLAFCMSGGVDSNAMISIAKRVLGYDVHGFTFTTKDERYDEMDMIRNSVKELGIRHTVVKGRTDEFLPRLRELIRYHDAPVHTVTWYANWMLMEDIAAKGYKISVNGIAADELFSGYYDHHLAYLFDVRDDEKLHRESLVNWRHKILPVVRNSHLRKPDLFVKDPEFRQHHYLEAESFASYMANSYRQEIEEERFTESLLRNRMLNELFYENVPVYMHEEDLNAMYFSIENRTPYLDRQLFEFCYRIPSKLLIRDGRAKAVLREAMRGIVPDAVLDCPVKVGFNAPIYAFLDVSDPEVKACVLNDGPIYEHVRKEAIHALIEKDNLPNSESKFLFAFLNCKMFMEEFSA